MKNLEIKKISGFTTAQEIPALLDREGIEFQPIDTVNWPEYPYKPEVKFRVAHTGDYILIHYTVTEASVRAVAPHDGGRVWEDACCEFFLQPETGEPVYYNFECNCAGTLLLNCGRVGDRHPAPENIMQQVLRWASLGREPFEERIGTCSWQLALAIPEAAVFNHSVKDFSGLHMRANFYKCGDLLQTPHFLSWNPIQLPKPCFHCPEFFGNIHFGD